MCFRYHVTGNWALGNNLFVKESMEKDAQPEGIRNFVHSLDSAMFSHNSTKQFFFPPTGSKQFTVPRADTPLLCLVMAATDNLHVGDGVASIQNYFEANKMKTKEQLRVEKESNGEEELVVSTHEKAAAILERIADSEDEPAQPSTPPQKKRKGMVFGNLFSWG